MNDKKYGVELTANIESFKKKLLDAKNLTNSVSEAIKNRIKEPMELAGDSSKKSFEQRLATIGKLSGKYGELVMQYLNAVSLEGKNSESANKLKQEMNSLTKQIEDEGNGLAEVADAMDDLLEGEEKVEKKSINLVAIFQNFESSLKKGINNIKRFSLSLLGIQSIYSMLSKATHAYMSQDQALTNKMQANWIALGAMFAPIIEKIIALFQRFVAYVNVFYKAFTGKNMIEIALKKVEKSTNKATKTTKALNKELANFDEITNLNFDSGAGDIDADIPSVADYLNELNKMELNPKIVKIIENFANKLKDVWKWIKKNKEAIKRFAIAVGLAVAGLKLGSLLTGFNLIGLTIGLIVADLYLAKELIEKTIELTDVLKNKKEAEKNLSDSQLKTLETAWSILNDETATEERKSEAVSATEAIYRQYLKGLKEGKKYTQEQKDYIEQQVSAIEKVSGKTFKTKIEAEVNAEMNAQNRAWWDDFFNKAFHVGSSGQTHGGGGRHFAKGNVAYEPTVAEFGEYSGANTNPEITAPQNMMRQTLFEALAQALPMINTGSNQERGDVVLNINGREFARATYSDYQNEAQRIGSSNVAIRRS